MALFSHEGTSEVLIELLSITRLSICHFGRNICVAKVIAVTITLFFGTALFNTQCYTEILCHFVTLSLLLSERVKHLDPVKKQQQQKPESFRGYIMFQFSSSYLIAYIKIKKKK